MNKDAIDKRLKIISDLQMELNGLKVHLDEILENDSDYQTVLEEVAKVKEESQERKAKISENKMFRNIKEQMKEKRLEITDNKDALSQELMDYYRESGRMEIEDENGKTRRLKFSVRLVN
ncbi:MAG TPA: hypothetical protein VJL30_01330 [Patescibacteria group bacterium]|uniref:Uncharacterized protein n=1 Tax=candidate division WWE3 bacterium RIFCSPHIGHO2_02_FULL_38_14 TaxID=1802620 RepID=A0A1F4V8Y0_UNCKA|nr:MAG: hypothetical protein A3D91_04460 [candidate division WWE3 bacterium RIFCSPHIGHO2_02_FULL_38_14]HLB51539.1 hypothetical protein [Patescibacteria group bacterium]